jgi:hypothetical protein
MATRDRSPLNLEAALMTTQKIYQMKMMDVNEERNRQIMGWNEARGLKGPIPPDAFNNESEFHIRSNQDE